MATLEQWQRRNTVREFDREFIPSKEQLTHIENCINLLPVQLTGTNRKFPNVVVMKLTPDDTELKKQMVEKIFNITEHPAEFFTQMYDAPYVYCLFETTYNSEYVEKSETVVALNTGVACGAILTEALSVGLDVATIACTKEGPVMRKTFKKRFARERELFKQAHGEGFDIDTLIMGIAVGKDAATNRHRPGYWKHKLGLPYFPGSKLPNRAQPFMFVE